MDNHIMPISPSDIEKKSFEIIDSEVQTPRPFSGDEWLVARRMIHTSADFELLSLIRFHPEAVRIGRDILQRGSIVITDTEMARMGISNNRMEKLGCTVKCFINAEAVKEKSRELNVTRASAAVDHALPQLNDGIYVVGNAPTALLRLMKWVDEEVCRPALIIGMPVGFVNAAESKDLLMSQNKVPFITIKGRKGGSALAASAVNQLAVIALERMEQSG